MSPKRHAILIGSSEFPADSNLSPLRCPANDVEGLRKLLRSEVQGDYYQDVVPLTNKPHYDVMRTVNVVLNHAKKNDFILIYYSGHGKLDRAGRLYLTASNTEGDALESTSIPVAWVLDSIRLSSCRNVGLILDCCYSGAVAEAIFRGSVQEQLLQASSSAGIYILTASTGVQVAEEKEKDEYGLLTKYIIQGVESGEADPNEEGRISMDELYEYVHRKVKLEGYQEPMKYALGVRGELIIALSGKSPREERRRQIRDLLLEYGRGGYISDILLSEALAVLALKTNELQGDRAKCDDLLRQLLDKKLSLGEFMHEWYVLKSVAPQVPRRSSGLILPPVGATKPGTVKTNPNDGQAYVWIPPGEFTMGCSPDDDEGWEDEKPRHTVQITRGFWLGQSPVTVGAYRQFAEATGIAMPDEAVLGERRLNQQWSDPEQPMVMVTWAEAKSYCESWAKGRLPTEAEWEYAARAGTTGTRYGDLDTIAWCADNSGSHRLDSARVWENDSARDWSRYAKILERNGNRIHSVNEKRANSWGLHDILGNVWEWVADWFDHRYYLTPSSGAINPQGPSSGTYRVLRGGSWDYNPRDVRASLRNRSDPETRAYSIGFRCARNVIP